MRRRKLVLLITFLFSLLFLDDIFNIQGISNVSENKFPTERKGSHEKKPNISEESYNFIFDYTTYLTQRQDTLNKACRKLGYEENETLTNIRAHMSPDLKVLYCRVNKCASTMTLELLKQLFLCDTECLIKVAERVRLNENAREIMNNAFKFMIVREPYGRLFSTYCNIFYFPKEDWLYRSTKIIKLTRLNSSYDSLTYGYDLTFAELVKYTVTNYEMGNRLDEHVRPMHHKSCNPCVFKFDFIAHLETLDTDFDFIVDKLSKNNVKEKYPQNIILSLKNWTIFGPIKHLFRTIPLLKGSNISLYNVYLRAWSYYQITGHILKTIEFPYAKRDVNYINKETFIYNIQKAMDSSAIYKMELKKQKFEAMMQAYSTISLEYMERLSRVVHDDCIMFGYEEKPAYLFGSHNSFVNSSNYRYFKGL